MPLTFPSHAAAVWPLHRAAPRLLPAAALIVGSCTPDLAYLFGIDGLLSHSLRGTFIFSLPMGLLMLAWLDLIAPPMSAAFPGPWFREPAAPRSAPAAARTLLALWLGALSHLLWDGFTHRTLWPASLLYPTAHVSLPLGASIHLANLLQHVSTVLGAVLVLVWIRGERSASAERPPRHRTQLAVAVLAGAAIAILCSSAPWHPWSLFWTATRGALIALTLVCLWLRNA